MDMKACQVHKLVADVCIVADGQVLLTRYLDVSGYDGETGWFLPDDYLHHAEHPEDAARRILKDQAGIAAPRLGLSHIESFEGHGSWHLIFHYLARMDGRPEASPGRNVREARWFPLAALPEPEQVAHGGWALETIRSALQSA